MENVLDNPAWNALISGNKHLSNGNELVKYFDKEVSPFVALKENTEDNFGLLYGLLPHNGPVLFVTTSEVKNFGPWEVIRCIKGFQMIYNTVERPDEASADLTPLADRHVPQMLALAKLTNPGPFESRTIAFGHYCGIFEEDKLVAMAGQRLHVFNYAEVSAVCTHPDHIGKGYARQLLLNQINRIKAASGIPFLHVRNDNERAIKVYERLGFSTRKEVYFYVLKKSQGIQ
jgi:ribosomal protein S18 acetylase RimI-like enzyme